MGDDVRELVERVAQQADKVRQLEQQHHEITSQLAKERSRLWFNERELKEKQRGNQ